VLAIVDNGEHYGREHKRAHAKEGERELLLRLPVHGIVGVQKIAGGLHRVEERRNVVASRVRVRRRRGLYGADCYPVRKLEV